MQKCDYARRAIGHPLRDSQAQGLRCLPPPAAAAGGEAPMPEEEASHAEAGVRRGEGDAQPAAGAQEVAEAAPREADPNPGQAEDSAAQKKESDGAGEAQRQEAEDAVPRETVTQTEGGAERQEQAGEPPKAPCCACENPSSPGTKKTAELRTVSNARNANKGLRYWTCAEYAPRHWQRPAKKRKAQGTPGVPAPAPGCSFFRWLDQPVETKEERQKAKKERLRKRELALLA